MNSYKVPVLSLRKDDRIKVGLERFELVIRIDLDEPGFVAVVLASGAVQRFPCADTATVAA